LDVYLERGTKRVFAGAPDWPGWARAGRNDQIMKWIAGLGIEDRKPKIPGVAWLVLASSPETQKLSP